VFGVQQRFGLGGVQDVVRDVVQQAEGAVLERAEEHKEVQRVHTERGLYMSKVRNSQKQVADDEQQKEMMVQKLQDKQTRLQHLKQSEIEVA